MTFSERMKLKRKSARLKLRQVAQKLEISIAQVSRLENGKRSWKPKILEKYNEICS